MRAEGELVDGNMNGVWTYWYHNGTKECELVFKKNKLEGGKVWNDNGVTKISVEDVYEVECKTGKLINVERSL